MAKILRIHEKDRKTWHAAAINGHTKFNKLLPLTQNEAGTLRAHNIITISQLYETNKHGILQNNPDPNVNTTLANEPELIEKLNLLRQATNRLHLPLQDKLHMEIASLLLRSESKMSSSYRKTLRTTETFNKAYNIIQLSSLPSKTKETSFQILNRTIWTNNKAYKSGARENPDCEYCGQAETMEHLIHDCKN
jgi:hypothetical protein